MTAKPAEKEIAVFPSMTPSAPITPLKPTHQIVAQHLVEGLTSQDIVTRTGLSPHTVRQYLRDIRVSVHCPPAASRRCSYICCLLLSRSPRPRRSGRRRSSTQRSSCC
ncbi:hypothetical protein NKH18_49255 [Streptomyces sp. M10(2022)]